MKCMGTVIPNHDVNNWYYDTFSQFNQLQEQESKVTTISSVGGHRGIAIMAANSRIFGMIIEIRADAIFLLYTYNRQTWYMKNLTNP